MIWCPSSTAVEEIFVPKLTSILIRQKQVCFLSWTFLACHLSVWFSLFWEKSRSRRVKINLLKFYVDSTELLFTKSLITKDIFLSTLAATDLEDIAFTLPNVRILQICVCQSLWDSSAESNSLLDGPSALLLLDYQTTFGWGGFDKARTALEPERRWLRWALDAFSLATILGRTPDWVLPDKPFYALRILVTTYQRLRWAFLRIQLVLGSADEYFYFLNGDDYASQTNPFKSRFATVWHLRLVNEADWLQHVGDIVESANLGLEKLFVEDFTVRYLLCCLLKRENVLPGDEKAYKLLTKIAKRLDFLILWSFFQRSSATLYFFSFSFGLFVWRPVGATPITSHLLGDFLVFIWFGILFARCFDYCLQIFLLQIDTDLIQEVGFNRQSRYVSP